MERMKQDMKGDQGDRGPQGPFGPLGPEGPRGQRLLLKQRPNQAALPPQSPLVPVGWPPTVSVCPVLFSPSFKQQDSPRYLPDQEWIGHGIGWYLFIV